MIRVEVILDSIHPVYETRLTTMLLEYPRFIHSQFMTHRVFSRNAASSRAIPVKKMVERIRKNPAMPLHWGMNQRGMQARDEIDDEKKATAKQVWLELLDHAMRCAERLDQLGVHKQVINRVLEPWAHIQVVVTATEWDNFFDLRLHDDAQPEIQELARQMKRAMDESTPAKRMWHIPFVRPEEERLPIDTRLAISVARCARTSYYYHDGGFSKPEQDMELYERLYTAGHWSPFEHQAEAGAHMWYNNFRHWRQWRYTLQKKKGEA